MQPSRSLAQVVQGLLDERRLAEDASVDVDAAQTW